MAVAGAAVTDWVDPYGLGDGNVRVAQSFGGSPWGDDQAGAYREQSPIASAHKIRAPTPVLSNTGDYRVPITQSTSCTTPSRTMASGRSSSRIQ